MLVRTSVYAPDECVHFGDLYVVQLLDGYFDRRLVCSLVHDKDQCVVVLNFLHGRLCCEREFHNFVLIKPGKNTNTINEPENQESKLEKFNQHVTAKI